MEGTNTSTLLDTSIQFMFLKERKAAVRIQSPQDLFMYNLCSMYDAEQKLTQVLPELARESQNPQVRDAFLQHEQETRQHVRNLEQCFQILNQQPMALENYAVAGLKQNHDTFLQQQP